jgi:hypothetical protein
MASDQDDEWDFDEIVRGMREANSYWYWIDPQTKDKGPMERRIVSEVLAAARLTVEELHSPDDEAPDCEAIVDKRRSGIEVTELADKEALKSMVKAKRQFADWREAMKHGKFLLWDQASLRAKVQNRIEEKDPAAKGHPYERYYLVIHSDELSLGKENVEEFLRGATFRSRWITDAYFALPPPPLSDGKPAVFKLNLVS